MNYLNIWRSCNQNKILQQRERDLVHAIMHIERIMLIERKFSTQMAFVFTKSTQI